ncbi:ATP-binding protein [Amycolatopsis sp. cmx-4-68]|uniref:ATP-binding protein n=1 Tax=Amycolatopsis sp. cmx-4-68 TaxID=2790938 RepID=UPI00397A3936
MIRYPGSSATPCSPTVFASQATTATGSPRAAAPAPVAISSPLRVSVIPMRRVSRSPRGTLRDEVATAPLDARSATVSASRMRQSAMRESFLAEPRPMVPYPIQRTAPLAELTDPQPRAARQAVTDFNKTDLPAAEIDDLVLAVSEIVDNALRYGRSPVRMRIWADAEHLVVTVHDTGEGPGDPFAGLLPAARDIGGRGLWITHQVCSQVALHRDDTGFTVRLTAGRPGHGHRAN